jgi:hypothetical protein
MDSETGRRDLIKAEMVAQLLKQHGIQSAVINACNSANPKTDAANLAKLLIEHGLTNVVAMSFKLATSAAEIFFDTFYKTLLSDAPNFPNAVAAGREALRLNPQRRANYGLRVHVHDWLVPVLYTNSADDSVSAIRTRSGMLRYYNTRGETNSPYSAMSPERARAEAERLEHPPEVDMENPYWTSGKLNPDFVGRDWEMLWIETLLARKPNSVLHIYGPPASGKSQLIEELGVWWCRTGFLTGGFYIISLSEPSFLERTAEVVRDKWKLDPQGQIVAVNEADAGLSGTSSRGYSRIIVIDAIDLIDQKLEKDGDCQELTALCEALPALHSSTTRIILVSWQKKLLFEDSHKSSPLAALLAGADKLQVSGLSPPDAAEFGMKILSKKGEDLDSMSRDDTRSLERLFQELAYLPGTIQAFLEHCSFTPEGVHPDTLLERRRASQNLGVFVRSPLFENLLYLLEEVKQEGQLVAVLLAPFTTFCGGDDHLFDLLEWAARHENYLPGFLPTPEEMAMLRTRLTNSADTIPATIQTDDDVRSFAKQALLHSWIQNFIKQSKIRGMMIDIGASGASNRLWIHPELTSVLRSILRDHFTPMQIRAHRTFVHFMAKCLPYLSMEEHSGVSDQPSGQDVPKKELLESAHNMIRREAQNYIQLLRLGSEFVGKKFDGESIVTYEQFWTASHTVLEAFRHPQTEFELQRVKDTLLSTIDSCLSFSAQQHDREELKGNDMEFPMWFLRSAAVDIMNRNGADAKTESDKILRKLLAYSEGRKLSPAGQRHREMALQRLNQGDNELEAFSAGDDEDRLSRAFSDAVIKLRYASEHRRTGTDQIVELFLKCQSAYSEFISLMKRGIQQSEWEREIFEFDTSNLTREELKLLTLATGLTLDHENGAYLSKQCYEIQKLILQGKVSEARKLVRECLDLAMMNRNLQSEYDFRRYLLEITEVDPEADTAQQLQDLASISKRLGRDPATWCRCRRFLARAEFDRSESRFNQVALNNLLGLQAAVLECQNANHQRFILRAMKGDESAVDDVLCFIDLCLSIETQDTPQPDLSTTASFCRRVTPVDQVLDGLSAGVAFGFEKTVIDDMKQLTGLEEKQVLEPIVRCNVDLRTRDLNPGEDFADALAAFERTWKARLFGGNQVCISCSTSPTIEQFRPDWRAGSYTSLCIFGSRSRLLTQEGELCGMDSE